jgi:hypothetical protein
MTYKGGAVRVKQDFTDDRDKLGSVIDVLANGTDSDGDGIADFADFSSAFGQDDSEFNVFSTDRKLAALQTAVTMLRPLPEQKSLVVFTSNLSLSGTDNNAQMRATVNAAIRANVGAPLRARYSYIPVSVLSDIAPEHIQELTYHDCFDTSMAAVGNNNALFVMLKPGIMYVQDVGSFVIDASTDTVLAKPRPER